MRCISTLLKMDLKPFMRQARYAASQDTSIEPMKFVFVLKEGLLKNINWYIINNNDKTTKH